MLVSDKGGPYSRAGYGHIDKRWPFVRVSAIRDRGYRKFRSFRGVAVPACLGNGINVEICPRVGLGGSIQEPQVDLIIDSDSDGVKHNMFSMHHLQRFGRCFCRPGL